MISPRLTKPLICGTLLAVSGCIQTTGTPVDTVLSRLSPECRRITDLQRTYESSLEALPPAPPLEVTQRIGWHSLYSDSPDAVEWLDLSFDNPESIDSIVLIPAAPDLKSPHLGYGFPARFRVEILESGDADNRIVLADNTHEDFPNPGQLPVFIPAHGQLAQKVRITATRLFKEGQRYLFALGEVMILRGNRNLGAKLEASGAPAVRASSSQGTRPDWGRINLVDGQSVLGPPLGPQPSPTLGYRSTPHSEIRSPLSPCVTVDLGHSIPIDDVRLFPAHPPEFEHTHGYGFPVRYQIELLENEDGDPTILTAAPSGKYTAPPGDNVVTILAGGRNARFVRLSTIDPHVSNGSVVLAMAEMQVWSNGKNVALGKPVSALDSTETGGWSCAALVDGFTSRYNIVDWPEWLAGLSQRREILHQIGLLEMRRALIVSNLKSKCTWFTLLFIGGGILFLGARIWRQQQRRREEMDALRLRFSQDLHDEIGSSLGCIAFITEDAQEHAGDESIKKDLREIREITLQTIDSMRDLAHMAQSPQYSKGDLVEHLRQIAVRVLRSIPFTLETGGAAAFNRLPMAQRRDVVLIFKELLHNLSRHANATQVNIVLSHSKKFLTLSVRDNGCGFDVDQTENGGMGMSNLRRRAGKHNGTLEIRSVPGEGTTITISFPNHD